MNVKINEKYIDKIFKVRVKLTIVNIAILSLLFVAITQYLASKLHYQSALGPWAFKFFGVKIYNPANWPLWAVKFGSLPSVKELFNNSMVAFAGSLFIILIANILYWKNKIKAMAVKTDNHGSAKWATIDDLKKAELRENMPDKSTEGVIVGGFEHNGKLLYLKHNGPEHIFCFAPTRSGKGVGLVIPTLLSWPESIVINDIKGDNWLMTGSYRKKELNQHVMKFEPCCNDGTTARFNPLSEIRKGTEFEYKDVSNVANMLVDPEGKGFEGAEAHWKITSRDFLIGVILHVLYTKQPANLAECTKILFSAKYGSDGGDDTQLYIDLKDAVHDPEQKMGWVDAEGKPSKSHPMVQMQMATMLTKADKERSSVLSSARKELSMYLDPIVANNTSDSDFTILDLMDADKPVSLYVVIPPGEMARINPLIRIFYAQLFSRLTENDRLKVVKGQSVRVGKHRLVMMMDEFPALGKLEVFEKSLAFIAGYGIKAYLISQDPNQLYKAYSDRESIISNCHVQIAYASNDDKTAETISKRTGQTTIAKENLSYSNGTSKFAVNNLSVSEQEMQRYLMTPDEVKSMDKADMLLFCAGISAVKGKKALYYKNPEFQRRADLANNDPHLISDRLIHTKNIAQSAPAQNSKILEKASTSGVSLVKEPVQEQILSYADVADENEKPLDNQLLLAEFKKQKAQVNDDFDGDASMTDYETEQVSTPHVAESEITETEITETESVESNDSFSISGLLSNELKKESDES